MEQNCLIQGTLHASQEEDTINNFLQNRQTNVGIVVYGKNANDTSAYIKHQELRNFKAYETLSVLLNCFGIYFDSYGSVAGLLNLLN